MRKETVVFNGITFVRYPESKSKSARRYFYPFANGRRMRGVGALHQEVWRAHHGPIPPGHHIHHRDDDWSNNDISNLEALTQAEHNRTHGNKSPAQQRHFARVQKLAAKWHGSEEGRRLHQRIGRESWKNRKPVDRTCAQCGTAYQTKVGRKTDRFCSSACEQRWHYHNNAARREDRFCRLCGKTFRALRYYDQQFCSRSCARRGRHILRLADDLSQIAVTIQDLSRPLLICF